eukprot:1069802-Pelagomonas_calceolata.AAC.1
MCPSAGACSSMCLILEVVCIVKRANAGILIISSAVNVFIMDCLTCVNGNGSGVEVSAGGVSSNPMFGHAGSHEVSIVYVDVTHAAGQP